jgi:hypothetical protein
MLSPGEERGAEDSELSRQLIAFAISERVAA